MVRSGGSIRIIHFRLAIALTIALLGFGAIIARLAYLQIASADYYRSAVTDQSILRRKLEPIRGSIKVVDSLTGAEYPLASTIEKKLVYAIPPEIKDLGAAANELAPILQMTKSELLDKFSDPNKKYVPLKRQLTDEEVTVIQDLKIPGIAFDTENIRVYPEKNLLSQVVGFVGFKGDERVGLYGLESFFEEQLKGVPGKLSGKAAGGLFSTNQDFEPALNGDDLILTIDKTIQLKSQEILAAAVKDNEADSGSIIVMDPKTGAVRAMANFPDFDPNAYAKVTDPALFSNKATVGSFEPGSTFKPLTLAAAMNENKIRPDTTYIDTGRIEIDGYTIKNSDGKANGVQTMTQVLEESLNTGAIYAKDLIGNKTFLEYLNKFGFGKKTGIELPETSGSLSNLSTNIKVNFHTATFGQGVTVTPIQMMQAFTTLANGGVMMKPYIVDKKVTADGQILQTKPQEVATILTKGTAENMTKMLISVVENGHGKKAGVPGYAIAGKTGTAQVPKKDGRGYEEDNNIGSFIGYGPAEDPKFLIMVRVNHPRTVKFAETTAAPAFGQLARFILNYYSIPPKGK